METDDERAHATPNPNGGRDGTERSAANGESTALVRREIDEHESVSEAVAMAVARAEGLDPTEMDPVFDAINADALDAIFGDRYDGTPRSGGRLTFWTRGYEIRVEGTRSVAVAAPGTFDA
ncbi:HalOD1 output domain-containing protein [Halegenticoccus soli]|uniref:HalOD1 output domain-containing protein n=1 Tax=Halegenticoccus soli TaxID=1985678 RepID=UPI000C6D95D8|nr:HalOD1 output domain-containing protein [Halegenticoccus soli]